MIPCPAVASAGSLTRFLRPPARPPLWRRLASSSLLLTPRAVFLHDEPSDPKSLEKQETAPLPALFTSEVARPGAPSQDLKMCSGDVATSAPSSKDLDALIAELQAKHRMDVENLTLTRQPLKTSKIFIVATMQYLKQSCLHVLTNGVWIMFLSLLAAVFGLLLIIVDGQHVHEVLHYFRFGLWWVALGVASSIGLGSGLHTFVLYLGPHIALFTIKAMKCGRVDLKSAPYDTIQLKRRASWLQRDCFEFGPPLYPLLPDSLVRVPISSILPQVQLEVILWGLGTALGELPPYFISRKARLSGSELDAMEEVDVSSSKEDGFVSATLKHIKRWFLSRLQHLNFFTILLLASVPNPLFDLAGIMCGQFGIPFWKFFLATLTGKAIIKTHIQTVFIISLCNNQLLEVLENEFIFAHQLIPGFSSMLTSTIAKLSMVQQKYLSTPVSVPSPLDEKTKQWNLSFALIWNTLIWFVLVNNFVKIVTDTAQGYLKKQHDLELMEKVSVSRHSNS